MDQELKTEVLADSWRTLLYMCRADAACAATQQVAALFSVK